jgi:RNA polymerase sigma-B factor
VEVTTEIRSAASLPRAEEERRFTEYRRNRDPRIRDELIGMHAPLARSLAVRFLGRGEPMEDLAQVAMLGLIAAVDGFEPERGLRFQTYAVPTIVGELRHYFRDRGWHLTVPRRLRERRCQADRAVEALSQELGRSPTIAEIAADINATEEETLQGMDAGSAYEILSLDCPLPVQGDESETVIPAEIVGSDDPHLQAVEERLAVQQALAALDPASREILDLRFLQELSQAQVAQRLGVSQMQVSRLQRRALDRLQHLLVPVENKQ